MPRVLIVDDDHADLSAASDALHVAGFEVIQATTGGTALDTLRDSAVDVVLADLRLPDMSALDILKGSARATPPFVIMTAFGSIEEAVEAMKRGVADFVQKPVPPVDLARIVTRVAQGIARPLTPQQIERTNITDPRVYAALEAIRQRFCDPALTCERLAAELGISRTFLARLLKRETDKSYLHHLHRRRVAEAERLLATTGLPIKEIAFLAGYASNTGRLDIHFKRFHRTTPTEWRRRMGCLHERRPF